MRAACLPGGSGNFYINGSVFAGGAPTAISRRITHSPVPKIANKIYLTLTMVERDNARYNQNRMRDIWDDLGRGTVTLNWSISPFLYDIGPAIFAYYQSTATPNDLLMCGSSRRSRHRGMAPLRYLWPRDWNRGI
jgi:GxGYxYP putative glycoside hydrolase C-terminal domain